MRAYELELRDEDLLKDNFKDCIFKVVPQHEYTAKKALDKFAKAVAAKVCLLSLCA